MKPDIQFARKAKINISGVILAGGASKRFNGFTKANIVIGGKRIINRITDTIKDIFDEIIIVTNTPEEFKEFSSYRIVPDQYLNVGPLGGIHAALKSSSKESVFIFAGDMPLLDKEIIIRQIEFYERQKCDILIPRINLNIEPLHAIYNSCVIIDLEEYFASDHDHSVRGFLRQVNVRYMHLKDSEKISNAFSNINSPADIPEIEKILGIGK